MPRGLGHILEKRRGILALSKLLLEHRPRSHVGGVQVHVDVNTILRCDFAQIVDAIFDIHHGFGVGHAGNWLLHEVALQPVSVRSRLVYEPLKYFQRQALIENVVSDMVTKSFKSDGQF